MLKKVILSKVNRNAQRLVIIIFLVLCGLIGYLSFRYYSQLQDTVKSESRGYMEEISRQMGTNINKSINDRYTILETMATVLKNSEVSSYELLSDMVEEQRSLWNYQSILLIDQNGVIYDDKGNVAAMSSDVYLQEVIMNRTPSFSASQVIGGSESIIFAIPIENITINGIDMLALAASYDLDSFDQMLAMSAFDGRGYAHIIRNDGSAVVRSSSVNALESGYNILNSLSLAKFHDGRKIESIKTDIAEGKSGQTEFTLDTAHEYMTFMPLGDQKWSLLTFVPVDVVNARSNMLLKVTMLMCGFVTAVFAFLLAMLFFTFYRNQKRLEQIAYVDAITGGNTIERFNELAEVLLSSNSHPQYALIYTNIEKFKVLNEQFGRKACDDILRSLQSGISADLDSDECIGRWFADNFCILLKYNDQESLVERFVKWNKNSSDYIELNGMMWLPLILEFGVYVIENNTMPMPQMIDRAKLSLNESTGVLHGKLRYAIYDEKARRILFREKQLEDRMEEALAQKEFLVYLQPKYKTQTEKIGGAEALVRWKSSVEGMIYPDEFITLFEKNGFITQLDMYVFEEVCRNMKRWLDEGKPVVKVSVNCSRQNLKSMDFLSRYNVIADQYELPHNLIEIELTENTVFEDVANLSEIIRKIHDMGFGCSMDDFGSGYSSLNLIQDIPVDTLKLDKIFFHNTRDMERNESVVGSIITMSKALSMDTVAEGVEKREQVDMLKRLKCDYIQGYYFAKPMPIEEFEQLAFGSGSSQVNEIEGKA